MRHPSFDKLRTNRCVNESNTTWFVLSLSKDGYGAGSAATALLTEIPLLMTAADFSI